MKTKCSNCQKVLSVPDNYKGKQIKCISCHKVSVAEPITETAKLQVSEQSAPPTSHRNQWIMAIIISVGLAWVIGFACGALLTRPNRDKTNATIAAIEVKAEASQEKAQKEIRAAKRETTRLQREFRSATHKLQQTEDDLRRVVAELEDTKNKAVIMPPIESKPIPQRSAEFADEQRMENNMNSTGYKTYCHTLLNEEGTIDIVMTSGSFKDNVSREAIDNYIGAAVATVGKFTSNAKWESRKLIIKVAFGKWYEISTSHCRKTVELFNKQLYKKASNYMFAHLKEVKNN